MKKINGSCQEAENSREAEQSVCLFFMFNDSFWNFYGLPDSYNFIKCLQRALTLLSAPPATTTSPPASPPNAKARTTTKKSSALTTPPNSSQISALIVSPPPLRRMPYAPMSDLRGRAHRRTLLAQPKAIIRQFA